MIALIGLIIIVWVMYKRDKDRMKRLEELDKILNDYYDRREQRIKDAFNKVEQKNKTNK